MSSRTTCSRRSSPSPSGGLAFGVLVLRELDQSFADTYSTVVSIQNVIPRLDRRALALLLGPVATVLALVLQIKDYQNFLYLIGSVFVPMFAVFVVDYFVLGRGRRWDVSTAAPARWSLLVPWFGGFVVYQLVNPGYVDWWQRSWAHVQNWLHFTSADWMSASLLVVCGGCCPHPAGRDRPRTRIRRRITRAETSIPRPRTVSSTGSPVVANPPLWPEPGVVTWRCAAVVNVNAGVTSSGLLTSIPSPTVVWAANE